MAFAEILVFAATFARETFAVSARAARRRRRLFVATFAIGLVGAGVGFATMIPRADEPIDDDDDIGERVRDGHTIFEVPAGFELAQVSDAPAALGRFEPLEPGAITMLVDASGVRVGGRSLTVGDAPYGSCAVPMPVVHALAWERRVWLAAHQGAETDLYPGWTSSSTRGPRIAT